MALKDLLVYADATPRGTARLCLAAAMARHQNCRLTVLYVKDLTAGQVARRKAAEFGLLSGSEIAKLDRRFHLANEAAAEQVQDRLKRLTEEAYFDAEWRCIVGAPATVVPQQARAADLCIVSQEGAEDDALPPGLSFSESLLFVTGRPVLFVPRQGNFAAAGRNVMIAWNGSRPATRAVSDALSLLEHADRVTLLTINARDLLRRAGSVPAEEMLAHLRRHGVPAETHDVESQGGPIADIILAAAHDLRADLLVAGAYGHPKLWERMFGGVTRDLLEQMTLPVMMSH